MLCLLSLQRCLRHLEECLIDCDSLHRACFKEHHVVVFLRPLLALGCRNLAQALLVQLVSKADKWEVMGVRRPCVFNESRLPSTEVLKASLVRDIVHKCAAVGTTVERIAERLELFLAGGIPDLQSDHCVID